MASPATKANSPGSETPSNPETTAEPSACPRWFWPALLGVCLIGGVLRFLLRAEYVANNPFAVAPTVDALTYWNWAGRIAAGQLSDGVPFCSAPLYPYLLGLLRAAGGGLPTVYAVQILLDLTTAGLLAWIARLRFGPAVGILAAAVFLLLLEPASFCLRVLASTLQLPLVCLAWLALLAAQRRPSLLRGILAGAALGLLALSYPPAMLCLPVFALWWWWNAGRNLAGLGRMAVAVAAGFAVISPATIHNYRVCGELIPISAQAGVTFAQGNAPGAEGIYTRIPGVSVYREAQNIDTFRIYRQETRQTPTWGTVNRYFFKRGWDYWRSDPARAARLFARKAYWFLTGRNYGDIYQPTMEIAEGLTTRLRFAPLHTAWLLPATLLAIGVWLRRFNTYAPELILFGVPLLVVVLFWFSPRYRLPAVPVIVVGSSWALCQALQWRRRKGPVIAFAVALAVSLGLSFANRAVGFDRREPHRPIFYNTLGAALSETGQLEQAVAHYQKALELQPDYAEAAANLGSVLTQLGRSEAALTYLRRAARANPADAAFRNSLGQALIAQNQLDEALAHFRQAVELNPRHPKLRNNLANALLLQDDVEGAIEQYRIALELDRTYADAHVNLGRVLKDQGRYDAALDHLREALRFDSTLVAAHLHVAQILLVRGDALGCIASLRDAQQLAPDDRALANELAWYLATTPGLKPVDRAKAVGLARQATSGPEGQTPGRLDTLAAALAANGQFAEAVHTAEKAISLAEELGAAEMAEQFRQRLELYKTRKPYVEPITPVAP